jgi:hypothetical protein
MGADYKAILCATTTLLLTAITLRTTANPESDLIFVVFRISVEECLNFRPRWFSTVATTPASLVEKQVYPQAQPNADGYGSKSQ